MGITRLQQAINTVKSPQLPLSELRVYLTHPSLLIRLLTLHQFLKQRRPVG